jgi:hypothetical protein
MDQNFWLRLLMFYLPILVTPSGSIIDPERCALCSTELERDRFGLPLRTETADIQH